MRRRDVRKHEQWGVFFKHVSFDCDPLIELSVAPTAHPSEREKASNIGIQGHIHFHFISFIHSFILPRGFI